MTKTATSRRTFLKVAGAAGVATALGDLLPGPRAYSAEPLTIGFVSIFSGRVAALGETGFRGLELALDEINDKGGLLGRPVRALKQDSAGKIEDAVRIARDFITRDRVDLIMDHSSSREAFAVREVSRDLKKVTTGMNKRYTLEAAEKLKGSGLPVLLTWAPGDRIFPLKHARRLAEDLPNARLVEIPGARTFVPVDQPARLADEIAGFVRG